MKKIAGLLSLLLCINQVSLAALPSESEKQDIQISNLLANRDLENPGMTPTGLQLKFFNGGEKPCWSSVINYRDVVVARAGRGYGCVARINRIELTPIAVANKLDTYKSTVINLDTSKDSTQIVVLQDEAPLFDAENGLISRQGTIKVQSQAFYW